MATATVRDLRTRFPRVRRLLEQEGEVVVTQRGRPVVVLRLYDERAARSPKAIDYYGRLCGHMPVPLSRAARRLLEDEERAER